MHFTTSHSFSHVTSHMWALTVSHLVRRNKVDKEFCLRTQQNGAKLDLNSQPQWTWFVPTLLWMVWICNLKIMNPMVLLYCTWSEVIFIFFSPSQLAGNTFSAQMQTNQAKTFKLLTRWQNYWRDVTVAIMHNYG